MKKLSDIIQRAGFKIVENIEHKDQLYIEGGLQFDIRGERIQTMYTKSNNSRFYRVGELKCKIIKEGELLISTLETTITVPKLLNSNYWWNKD